MGTTTTRLGLFKPDPDPVTGDDVDVVDLNDNSDRIDGNIGYVVCTSGTRPGTPWQGMPIYETDTGFCYVWTGAAWLRILNENTWASAVTVAGDLVAARGLFGGSSGNAVKIGDDVWLVDVNLADRVGIQGVATPANGGIIFGSGLDTNLYRSAANTLKTDDTFLAANVIAGDTGWTNATLAAGWASFGGGWAPARYRKTSTGIVMIEAMLTGPGAPATIFTLPAGYRPSSHLMFAGNGDGVHTRVDVLSTGVVAWAVGGSAGYFGFTAAFYVG